MPPDSSQISTLISEPRPLLEILSWVFAVLMGVSYFGSKIWQWWQVWRKRRALGKDLSAVGYTREDIRRATTHYLKPNCQSVDPAQGEEGRYVFAVQNKLFDEVDRLLASPWENKYSILLADSGMGKTSFVLNYYAQHQKRWRKRFKIAVVPLGIRNADEHIARIQDKADTVLFLDAFDEDTHAIRNHRERLDRLLDLSGEFRQVLITCRTQFFLKEEEIPRETGVIKVGAIGPAENREHVFYKLYLSPFSDEQVEEYLQKRFSLWNYRKRQQARAIAHKIPHLTARPMLLAHIRDLVQSGKSFEYAFQLYEEMVEAWLERERYFVKDKNALRKFSESLAVDLYLKREVRGSDRVPAHELEPLAKSFNISLAEWQLRGRSLLNHDAAGNYKFAHRSIMEYLFVKRFLDGDVTGKTPWTDQMKRFLLEMVRFQWNANRTVPSNLSEADLSDIDKLDFKPLVKLRAQSKKLEASEVQKMLNELHFFDSRKNNEGRGIIHLYQQQELKGEKVIVDLITGLMWQQSGFSNRMTYAEAEKYIRDLNQQRFAGYSDWRLPTLEEAMSLMEPKKKNGDLYIESVFDQQQTWIWTADRPAEGRAWVVTFYYGLCTGDPVDNIIFVRAVR